MTNNTGRNPTLVYDGDCQFCTYWINYWQKLTNGSVTYKPYQQVAGDYPDISTEEFQQAIQYITPEGEVSSGAKATFKTLNHAKGYGFWLWLYTWLPGFAFLSERFYSFVSRRRDGSFKVSKLLWGPSIEPSNYSIVTWFFLRLMGVVFFIAFLSFTWQALGLIGADGIVPVNNLKEAAYQQLGWERFWYIPMLFWINSSDLFIKLVCWSGLLFSLFLTFNIIPRISLLVLYATYLSLIYAGQLFMSYQWDLLLIEISLISFFLIRYQTLGVWLLRWLLFRFMLASGLVKIMSGDTAWWDMSALNYHFLTQPLPTPLAYYAAGLPNFLLSTATFLTLLIELVIVFFIFGPKRLRYIAAYSILLLQVCIMLTGNYNFFNITTIILCISLFDNAALVRFIPSKWLGCVSQKLPSRPASRFSPHIATAFAVITIALSLIQFQIRFVTGPVAGFTHINGFFSPFRAVNTYGPFAVVTKKRLEIIFEGSQDGRIWREYEFKYKPGDIYRRAQWNIPFQPRLDWQMWFAALGPANKSPWISRLIQRLLENSPHVTGLLAKNPFPDRAPTFVRALIYDYNFSTNAERKEEGIYWDRWLEGVYFPPANLKKKDDDKSSS